MFVLVQINPHHQPAIPADLPDLDSSGQIPFLFLLLWLPLPKFLLVFFVQLLLSLPAHGGLFLLPALSVWPLLLPYAAFPLPWLFVLLLPPQPDEVFPLPQLCGVLLPLLYDEPLLLPYAVLLPLPFDVLPLLPCAVLLLPLFDEPPLLLYGGLPLLPLYDGPLLLPYVVPPLLPLYGGLLLPPCGVLPLLLRGVHLQMLP